MTTPDFIVDHRLGADAIHTCWDRSIPPRLTIRSGETVTFDTFEPTQGVVAREVASGTVPGILTETSPELLSLVASYVDRPPAKELGVALPGHALTGPVYVEGAEPGDTLAIDILEVLPGTWGWTSLGPKHGSLVDGEVDSRVLHLWDLRAGDVTHFGSSIQIPIVPFCGVMGVAPAESGQHPTSPPRAVGGNLDVRQLTAGSTLYLPVMVPGALFSTGDAHAAQGDGEVCGTAIEMDAKVTLRFTLVKGKTLPGPRFRTRLPAERPGEIYAASANDADLYAAARSAVRGVLDYLEEARGLTRTEACVIASVCVDLRISQIVNAGVFTVTALLPLSIFVD